MFKQEKGRTKYGGWVGRGNPEVRETKFKAGIKHPREKTRVDLLRAETKEKREGVCCRCFMEAGPAGRADPVGHAG